MKSLKNTFTLLVVTLFLITSCENNEDVGPVISNPFTPPSAEAFETIQDDAFNDLKQIATFNAEDGINFVSDAGVSLSITGTCLSLDGNPVTGEIDLEFVEVFDRGNMLTTNATTVGENQSGERAQLISGGEFHIKAYQNGEELTLDCGMMLNVPTAITGGEVPGMGPFEGEIDNDGNLVWLPQNTEFWISEQDSVQQVSQNYNAFVENFGWFNCDVFVSDPDPKTEIQLAVPQGFDNTNSSVYMARVGEPNSLAYIYGEFPIGLEAHIIFLSEQGGEFLYAIKSITVEDGQQVSFTVDEINSASTENLTQIINDLP